MSELRNKVAVAALTSLGVLAMGGAAMAGTYDTAGSSAAASDSGVVRVSSSLSISNISSGIDRLSGGGGFGGGFGGGVTIGPTASLQSGNTGFAAGGNRQHLGIWANAAYTHIDFDNPLLPYKGHFANGAVGADYLLRENLIVGVALGYENSDLTTTFNDGTLKTDGYNVAPYVALRLNRFLVASLTGGYAGLSTDVTRSSGAITGSYDGHRWFGAASLGGTYVVNRWELGGSVGYLYTRETADAYTESAGALVASHTTSIGQGRAGVRIGYRLGGITPYVMGRVEHDFTRPADPVVSGQTVATGDTGYVVGGGLNFGMGNVSGGVEATSTQGRDSLTQYGVMGTIRVRF